MAIPLCISGCGTEQEPRTPTSPVTPKAAAPRSPSGFENPGGMWMPEQMADHAEQLRALGLEFDPMLLTNPTAFPLGAVIHFDGCSASFVSSEGLIATNHHCATRALQYSSTPGEDLLTNGYLARSRADERWAGPGARALMTRSFRDVTSDVRRGLEGIADPAGRAREVARREKQLVADCERGRPAIRCSVAAFFGGGRFSLIEQVEIRDLRMVYVPPRSIGAYGGDIDNWRWPRHAGDFAFFRAYVGADNEPAEHSAGNVPYRPPHHLRLATSDLDAGDLVMVAGYPGRTNRLRTAAEVESAVSWRYPEQIRYIEEYMALLEKLSAEDPALRIKAEPTLLSLSNTLIKLRGLMDGLVRGGLAREKVRLERELEAWIERDPARKAAFGGVVEAMARLHAEQQRTRVHDTAVAETVSMVRLLGAALTIVQMAEERAKPDAERDPEFQERNWARLEQAQVSLQRSYDRRIDRASFDLALARVARLPSAERPAPLAALVGRKGSAVAAFYAGTRLEDLTTRLTLLRTATAAELAASRDPFIRLALEMRPVQRAIEARDEAHEGAMLLERPRYVEALRQAEGGLLAPDANGTLRITYGTVRGYRPEPAAPLYRPFTVLSGVVEKNTGKPPFDAPKALLEAFAEKKLGPYVDPDLGEVPVCFLSDLDITGGNSGSATLNRRGELVGLAFDGNYESMASDWLFMPAVTRTIHVDLRYMLWVMDAVGGADNVLRELGVTPAIE